MPGDPGTLPLTGERTVPGIWHENYWFRRHEAVYAWAFGFVRGRVLEIGCGEGYGAARLAHGVDVLLAIDYDALTIRHAARIYRHTHFTRANLAALPVREGVIDRVVSFQVIEHVWHHGQFLAECRRVLHPEGRLLLSTPNRFTFSPGQDRPANLFHTHEFTPAELLDLVRGNGYVVEAALGLHAGSRLRELDAYYGGSFAQAQLAAPPEQWDEQLRRDVAEVSVADFEISGSDLDAALDLILLAGPAEAGAAQA